MTDSIESKEDIIVDDSSKDDLKVEGKQEEDNDSPEDESLDSNLSAQEQIEKLKRLIQNFEKKAPNEGLI